MIGLITIKQINPFTPRNMCSIDTQNKTKLVYIVDTFLSKRTFLALFKTFILLAILTYKESKRRVLLLSSRNKKVSMLMLVSAQGIKALIPVGDDFVDMKLGRRRLLALT